MYMLKCRPKLDSGAESYCGLWEKKEDFIPLAHPLAALKKCVRWRLQRCRCCRWHLVTQGQWPGVAADCPRAAALKWTHSTSPTGGQLGDRSLKHVSVQSQGQKVGNVHFTSPFPHRTGASVVGTLQIPSVKQERKLYCGTWLSGLPAACGGNQTYQMLWGHKPSWFSVFGEALLRTSIPLLGHPCESTSSSSEICQCFGESSANPVLEMFS